MRVLEHSPLLVILSVEGSFFFLVFFSFTPKEKKRRRLISDLPNSYGPVNRNVDGAIYRGQASGQKKVASHQRTFQASSQHQPMPLTNFNGWGAHDFTRDPRAPLLCSPRSSRSPSTLLREFQEEIFQNELHRVTQWPPHEVVEDHHFGCIVFYRYNASDFASVTGFRPLLNITKKQIHSEATCSGKELLNASTVILFSRKRISINGWR